MKDSSPRDGLITSRWTSGANSLQVSMHTKNTAHSKNRGNCNQATGLCPLLHFAIKGEKNLQRGLFWVQC